MLRNRKRAPRANPPRSLATGNPWPARDFPVSPYDPIRHALVRTPARLARGTAARCLRRPIEWRRAPQGRGWRAQRASSTDSRALSERSAAGAQRVRPRTPGPRSAAKSGRRPDRHDGPAQAPGSRSSCRDPAGMKSSEARQPVQAPASEHGDRSPTWRGRPRSRCRNVASATPGGREVMPHRAHDARKAARLTP